MTKISYNYIMYNVSMNFTKLMYFIIHNSRSQGDVIFDQSYKKTDYFVIILKLILLLYQVLRKRQGMHVHTTVTHTSKCNTIIIIIIVLPYSTKFSLDKNFAQCSCFVLAQKFRRI